MNIQQHLTTNSLSWKEIELDLFRALQNAFAELFTALLRLFDKTNVKCYSQKYGKLYYH